MPTTSGYLIMVAGIALVAVPAARALEGSAEQSFEGSTLRFDKPGTYVGGEVQATRGGGGRATLAGGGDGWISDVRGVVIPAGDAHVTRFTDDGDVSVVVADRCQGDRLGAAPTAPFDPSRPRYGMGGHRDGLGHTWAAVELPDGRVARYDFAAEGWDGDESSLGALGTLWTDGDARVTYHDSWEAAAGGHEVYTFETTPERAAEVLRRMQADAAAPPDYSLIFQNCTDRAFHVMGAADPRWEGEASGNVMPSGALDRARARKQAGAGCAAGPSSHDTIRGRRDNLRAIDEGTYDPPDWSRLGAYEATRGYPPGTVGHAVHRAIGLIYLTFGTFGEERIGEVFHSEEARQHYPHPVDGPHSRAMAELEYEYWRRVYEANPDSWGGWMGTRFPGGARDWIQWILGGMP